MGRPWVCKHVFFGRAWKGERGDGKGGRGASPGMVASAPRCNEEVRRRPFPPSPRSTRSQVPPASHRSPSSACAVPTSCRWRSGELSGSLSSSTSLRRSSCHACLQSTLWQSCSFCYGPGLQSNKAEHCSRGSNETQSCNIWRRPPPAGCICAVGTVVCCAMLRHAALWDIDLPLQSALVYLVSLSILS